MNEDTKTAFVFPGVGVKHCGREGAFFERHQQKMARFLATASSYADTRFESLITAQKIDSLQDREQQFFTYAYSSAVAEVFRGASCLPHLVAGYSFGVYGALYASGAINFDTGLQILDSAYTIMSSCAGETPAGMGVVVGLDPAEIEDIISGMSDSTIRLATTNSPTCLVVSGHKTCLTEFLRRAKERDAFSADQLPVDIPYHHPTLLKGAAPEFKKLLKDLPVLDPVVPLVSTIDQQIITTRKDLIDFIAQNLSTPIDWSAVARSIHSSRILRICECGPGISLSQNGRFLPYQDTTYINIKNARRRLGV